MKKKLIPLLLILLTALLLSSCGNHLPIQAAEVPTEVAPQEANISFLVTLSEPIPANRYLALQVADTLTGDYTFDNSVLLQKADDLHYNVVLPLTTQAILQYRYILLDSRNNITYETDIDGLPIHSRFYFPTQASLINDRVYNWTRDTLSVDAGRIQGTLTAQDGLTPLEGVIVSAGGQNTLTAADGTFTLHALPTGKHTLTVFPPDFAYHPYTQEAIIAKNMATPVQIKLEKSQTVLVNFHVIPPKSYLPNTPISLSGSIPSLGKTYCFTDIPCANLPENTPDLSPNTDGTFSFSTEIPMGFNLTYHYTIGNETFNIEHNQKGLPVYRSLHVTEAGASVEAVYDEIIAWTNKKYKDIWFNLQTPAHTPTNEIVSIQLRERGAETWTAAIPLWRIDDNHWSYRISSVAEIDQIEYRYCRNSLCGEYSGLATDQDSPLKRASFTKKSKLTLEDHIEWLWLQTEFEIETPIDLTTLAYQPTPTDTLKGIAISNAYTAPLDQYLVSNIGEVSKLNGDTLVFSPTWTVTHNTPPTITPLAGQDMPTETLTALIKIAKNAGYTVILHPQLVYQQDYAYWWFSAPIDDAWWVVWFEQYQRFVNHFATLAQQNHADALIIGDDNILPATPKQPYPNGTPLNHPGDLVQSWIKVYNHARVNFDGQLFWATNPTALETFPGELKKNLNGIYLLWAQATSQTADVGLDVFTEHAIYDLAQAIDHIDDYENLALYLAIGYPSANGAWNECVLAADDSCLDGFQISPIEPFLISSASNFEIQNQLYLAMLQATTQYPEIDGIFTTNFFNAVRIQAKSASINGKPAQESIRYWYERLNP